MDVQAKYWPNVMRDTDGCWEWAAYRNRDGYGTFRNAATNSILATHTALLLDGRPRPSLTMIALHSCDNPGCVNPSHLRWGTRLENQQEMSDRRRTMAQRKEVCRNGHPFDTQNTRIERCANRRVARRCRRCQAEAVARYRNKLR